MTLRTAHGSQRGKGLVVEVLPADELPAGVAGPSRVVPPRGGARWAPGDAAAKAAGALGGRARAEQLRLSRLLGLVDLPEKHPMHGYRRDASDWRDAHLSRLSATVGGGEVGPAVQAIVSTAALQHAASRWLFDRSVLELSAELALTASRLADSARQNILAAHELCAREAQARQRQQRQDPQAAMRVRLGLAEAIEKHSKGGGG